MIVEWLKPHESAGNASTQQHIEPVNRTHVSAGNDITQQYIETVNRINLRYRGLLAEGSRKTTELAALFNAGASDIDAIPASNVAVEVVAQAKAMANNLRRQASELNSWAPDQTELDALGREAETNTAEWKRLEEKYAKRP